MRVFAISDLHVDFPENMAWLRSLSAQDYVGDTLLVAGDVCHDFGKLEEALRRLREKFAGVFFVPGNHELWLTGSDCPDSLEKFDRTLDLCRSLGVEIGSKKVGEGAAAVWVVPLFAWYVKPEEGADSLFLPNNGDRGDLSGWGDERFVRWPSGAGAPRAADCFLERNLPHLKRAYDAPVISFSHFLPRPELMFHLEAFGTSLPPRVRFARGGFNFSRVAGTRALDEQIRTIGSRVHIHGHQHRNRWRTIEGILYVSHCLGYGRERAVGLIRNLDNGPKLVWERGALPAGQTDSY